MIEEPNFDYQYDLFMWKSFFARLSLTILVIAAGVFLMALLAFLYISEEKVREETAMKARSMLHEAVVDMKMMANEAVMRGDTVTERMFIDKLSQVKPYKHSITLLADSSEKLVFVSDSLLLGQIPDQLENMAHMMSCGERNMEEVQFQKHVSLLIYEPVGCNGLSAALVCTRIDIISSFKTLFYYGAAAFVVGLLLLFVCSLWVVQKMVKPLHLFANSAMDIAHGNLEAPLPDIRSEDELLQLRNAFGFMQTSLRKYIEDLKTTTIAKERFQSELTIAHDIQMGMIPTAFPHRDDIDLFAALKPAKEVGGDLYDFIVDNEELFFIIGDVAGKGVPASLFMAVTRTLFRNLAGNYQSAANVVREINHAIISTNDSCLFVTLFVGVLDLRTHMLFYCNAAHNPPVLINRTGDPVLLDVEPNVPVGVIDHYDYKEQQIHFVPGTSLLLYTDGLTEAVNKDMDMYGEKLLLEQLALTKGSTARDTVEFMQRSVMRFAEGAEQSDDITMLFLSHKNHENAAQETSQLTLRNEMAELDRLRGFVWSVCREHGASEGFCKDVNLAMEEAVVNVIHYAYPKGTMGHLEIMARTDGDQLVMTITDSGVAFDPTKANVPDTEAHPDDRPIGGLGIFIVQSIMDEVAYHRTEEGKNVLTLTKRWENGL